MTDEENGESMAVWVQYTVLCVCGEEILIW